MAAIHEFFHAMHTGDEIRARQLLALSKLDPNAVDPGHERSWRERLGARPAVGDGLTSLTGFSALHVAVWRGHDELASDLIEQGADVNHRTNGLAPIHLARSGACVAALAQGGADMNAVTTSRAGAGHPAAGSTAFHLAVMHQYGQDVIKELLAQGADPNIANSDGFAPLHIAAGQHTPTYEQLIAGGAKDDAGASDRPRPSDFYRAMYPSLAGGETTPEQAAAPAAGQTTPEQAEAPAGGQTTPEQTEAPAAGQTTPEQAEAPAAGQTTPEQTEAPAAGQTTPEQAAVVDDQAAEKLNEIEIGESEEVGQPGATADPTVESDAGEPVQKPILTKSGFVVPKVIKDLYVEVEGKYVDRRTEEVSFEDSGRKLTTESNDRKVIEHMIALAHAKGWATITVTGAEEFRRETWIAAQVQGLTVKGYEPTKEDVAAAVARKEAMRIDAGKVTPARERNQKGGEIEHEVRPERPQPRQPSQEAQPAQAVAPQVDQTTPERPVVAQAHRLEAGQSAGPNDDVPPWTQEEYERMRAELGAQLAEDREQRAAREAAYERERLNTNPTARENFAREVLRSAGLDPKELLAADGAVKDQGRMTKEKFDALVAERAARAHENSVASPSSPEPFQPTPSTTTIQSTSDHATSPAIGQPAPVQGDSTEANNAPASARTTGRAAPLTDPNTPATGQDAKEAALRVALEAEMEEIGVPTAQRDELRGQLAHNISEAHKNGIALDMPEPLTMNAMPAVEQQRSHDLEIGKESNQEITR